MTLFDLVKTFQEVLDRLKNRPTYEVGKEEASVPDMIRYLETMLKKARPNEPISATRLFEQQRSRRAMICLFLAILELVKRQAVLLTQTDAFGDIGLKKNRDFDEALGADESLAAIKQEYS